MKFKRYLTLTLLICAGIKQSIAQTTPVFVQEDVVKTSGITTDAAMYALPLAQRQATKVYYDGMGRPIQSIAVQASPAQNDMIQPVAYNNLGQQTTGYLPYAGKSTDLIGSYRPNAVSTDQAAFYNQTSQYLVTIDSKPYSQQVFENSPLQRVLQAGMMGNGFQPGVSGNHWKTVNYRYNVATTDGNILVWNANGTFTTGSYYVDNSLSVTDATDEDNNETLSFTDIVGRTILKRQILSSGNLDTYYIYNTAGMLTYIVPPAATAILAANSYNLAVAPLSSLIFTFVHDTQGRVIQKIVPGTGIVYIIYDPLSRPVLVQDGNMRATNTWNYIKYDIKGRPISQGIYTDATHNSYALMQAYVSGLSYATAWYETRANAPTTGYYTDNIFPTAGLTPLAYEYYDDYDLTQAGSSYFSYSTQGLTGEETATTAMLKGMPTMLRKCTVGSGLSSIWLTSVTFYDHNLHVIQSRSNNHMFYTDLTLTDSKTIVPDFIGMPTVSQTVKKTATSTTTTVKTTITYDQVYRVKTVDQVYNGGTTTYRVGTYIYNELGQTVGKQLGSTNAGANWLQQVDFRFNIRGQLTSINNSRLAADGGHTDDDSNPLFGMTLLYDGSDSILGNTPYYNGKLSAVKWSNANPGHSIFERSYKYSYDNVNRYTGESYGERLMTSGTSAAYGNLGGWDETVTGYDVNGNITGLTRYLSALGGSSRTQIDNLTYTYSSTIPNQLFKVTDAAGNINGFGIQTGGSATGNYTYDSNGNLTADPYKALTLAYDVLNKTDKITMTGYTGRYINYTYDASGTLLRKQVYDSNTLQHTTDYLDGFVYLDGTLLYFAMPEGRVLNSGGTLNPEYVITDQQGNARISFDNTGTGGTAKIRQENSYYGFGMILPNSTFATPTNDNKHLYNGGAEWQNDYSNMPDYQQTFYRNYDAAIGRFVAVDPEAESAESMTTYQYGGNNPIMMNDPLGNIPEKNPPAFNSNVSEFDVEGLMNMEADLEEAGVGSFDALVQTGGVNTWGLGETDNGIVGSGGYGVTDLNEALGGHAPPFVSGTSIYRAADPLNGVKGSGMSLANLAGYFAEVGNPDGGDLGDFKGGIFNYQTVTQYDEPGASEGHGELLIYHTLHVANQGGDPYPRGAIGGPVPYYGNFVGPGPDGPKANPYQLLGYNGKILKPIDMVDAAAQRHDYAYWMLKASGVNAALWDDRTGYADRALASSAQSIVEMYAKGINDSITHSPISLSEYQEAQKIEISFGFLGGLKYIGNLLGR